jgi:hypothetical protein
MMDTNQRKELASNYSWQEILTPMGISQVSAEETTRGIVTVWEVDDDPSIRFRTYGETDHIFLLDEAGELRLPFDGVSKYEALRRLHFNSQSRLTDSFMESGASLVPNIFDLLFEARNDRVGGLDPTERYFLDAAFRRQVDVDQLRIESHEEAGKRAREAKNRLEDATPPALLLSDFLDKELSPEKFLIEGLIPTNGTVTVVAAKKTGKSTFIYNVMHSLLTLEPLLGAFPVSAFEGRIGFVNYELTEEQAQDWFRRSPIGTTDRIAVWNLRGKPNPFRSEQALSDFAKEVKALGIQVLILDPFSSAFRGGNSQDNDEVKDFWLRTDAFKEASGVNELIIPVHAGRDESRSRGASALDDHPDAILHLNKLSDGTRTFHAFGRDVEVEAGELEFDKVTLLLSYKGPVSVGSRVARVAKVLEAILKEHGKLGATDLTRHARKNKDDVRAARELLVSTGRVLETQVGQSKFYEIAPSPTAPSPTTASGDEPTGVVVASSPYMGEATTELPLKTGKGRCSKCSSKGEPPFVFLGIGILMCWDCIEVIDAWSEDPAYLSEESEDSDSVEVIREI